MSIRIVFQDNSVVDYPEGVSISDGQNGALRFINNIAGEVIASIPSFEIREVAVLP